MRSALYIIFIVAFVSTSCDPIQFVYLKNNTDEDIKVFVNHLDRYVEDSLRMPITYIDSIISDCSANTHLDLIDTLEAEIIDPNNYYIVIPKRTTSLIEPTVIGMPIKWVTTSNKTYFDTLFFNGSESNWKTLRDKGYIEKSGFLTFSIEIKE